MSFTQVILVLWKWKGLHVHMSGGQAWMQTLKLVLREIQPMLHYIHGFRYHDQRNAYTLIEGPVDRGGNAPHCSRLIFKVAWSCYNLKLLLSIVQVKQQWMHWGPCSVEWVFQTLVSDNVPQFKSQEFKDFLDRLGVLHKPTQPYHPSSNRLVEQFVQTVKQEFKSYGLRRVTPPPHPPNIKITIIIITIIFI